VRTLARDDSVRYTHFAKCRGDKFVSLGSAWTEPLRRLFDAQQAAIGDETSPRKDICGGSRVARTWFVFMAPECTAARDRNAMEA